MSKRKKTVAVQKNITGLGVYYRDNEVHLIYRIHEGDKVTLHVDTSSDGINFKHLEDPFTITSDKKSVSAERVDEARVSKVNGTNYLTFKYYQREEPELYGASSENMTTWQNKGKIAKTRELGVVVPDFRYRGKYIMYTGGSSLRISTSSDLTNWDMEKQPIMPAPAGSHLEMGGVFNRGEGIMLVYFENIPENSGNSYFAMDAVVFDKRDPKHVLWKTDNSLWEQPAEWRNMSVRSLGVLDIGGKLISYWQVFGVGIIAVIHPATSRVYDYGTQSLSILKRIKENPIIKPIAGNFWESKATFNPAAVYDEDKVHILYRAIGDHDISVLGYASSKDGVNIDERSSKPVYVPKESFEISGNPHVTVSPYASGGGGYGGCEDPRITKIDDKMYMTYVAYDGSGPPRVALTSIAKKDFRKKNWKWKKPVLISPPDVVDKNCVIFPEKINGKYCIMHRIYPNILIDYVDDLDSFDGKTFLKGDDIIRPRRGSWDSRKVGAGAPPIKTDDGWLLIYHAVGENDPGRYKMGAMLLDHDDPSQVIARTNNPLLEPEVHYENEGFKYGVAYPCGAVTIGDKLYVYYGGADMVTCVAHANTQDILDNMLSTSYSAYEPVTMHRLSD